MNKYWQKFLLASVIFVVVVYAVMIAIDFTGYLNHGSQCGLVKPSSCSFAAYLNEGLTFYGICGKMLAKFIVIPILVIPAVVGMIIDVIKKK